MGLFSHEVCQARCGSCGWRGPERTSAAAAEDDLRQHRC